MSLVPMGTERLVIARPMPEIADLQEELVRIAGENGADNIQVQAPVLQQLSGWLLGRSGLIADVLSYATAATARLQKGVSRLQAEGELVTEDATAWLKSIEATPTAIQATYRIGDDLRLEHGSLRRMAQIPEGVGPETRVVTLALYPEASYEDPAFQELAHKIDLVGLAFSDLHFELAPLTIATSRQDDPHLTTLEQSHD